MPNRLFVDEILSVGMVKAGDNPDAEVLLFKSRDVDKRQFSTEQREALADKGQALPDGSFPIVNKGDLRNAIGAFGRSANKTAARRHIIKRAKALGATEMLPDGWDVSKMTASVENAPTEPGVRMDLSAIEDQELRKSIEDTIAEKDNQISDLTDQVDKVEADPTEDASDEVKAILKEQADKLEKVTEDLAKERQERRTAEYIEKAKPLEVLLGKADDIGPVLAELAEAAPEAFAKLEAPLTAASQRKELAALFAETGAGEGEGESDPISKRDAWVKENKKDTESAQQANARFWKEHPEQKEESRS